MLTRYGISYIYLQLTVYHHDHVTTTHLTHNSAEELLHPNIIKEALPVSLNQNCHVASEYYGQKSLYSSMVSYHNPSRIQDKTRK